MKLTNIIEIKATLLLKSGLHIGAGDNEMHIGGIDNSVVKNPITNRPYIPGSSLKGKIRSLLEWKSGEVKNKPLSLNDLEKAQSKQAVELILKLFGVSGDAEDSEKMQKIGASRLVFWDCDLNETWANEITQDGLSLTEAKSENTIDRITATAGNPRLTERVPAGAEFDFKLMIRVFDEDDKQELLNTVLSGLKLLELDSLGGSGSRGYGKVKFTELTVDGETRNLDDIKPFE
ncbi:type III-A CRISPR-associated RAMP protein Csm3 [uncultured Aggregatibacter sp.]|uniref:type III-A CRISPR-associated RAMP protein Csm3 n=1 Tax=uncultured Aggregatibacter sp. TaxID=470564 RepID=UPI001A599947|nr:type III-A CRISPR-associated RAMP protein Csm3 [uncultured Aggregatibacter sp.]VTX85026.1 CRISPR type III-associated RAMP protein Csm3 [uncultured Aggregatibacter sp.]